MIFRGPRNADSREGTIPLKFRGRKSLIIRIILMMRLLDVVLHIL